ncbi:hypothetical protein BZG36_05370 [Bifiguratus adelaidae]|uniref:OPT family small oligopeptide transporter n=1 Tax=Bifiguratus adelaidae TaxID=1938954 RepID=A0A261XTK4_9FUNG|nr:hypothetical protein BZG36_05370 [Bifiguratus adelaidae]
MDTDSEKGVALEIEAYEKHVDDVDSSDADQKSLDENTSNLLVAAVVPPTDDPTLPTLTFRVWVLGCAFAVLGAAIAEIFYFKSNPLRLGSFFIGLVTYPLEVTNGRPNPLGYIMAKTLPTRIYKIGRWEFSLNPGPWNAKEHSLAVILASSGASAAYATGAISVQTLNFKVPVSAGEGVLLLLTTQLLGYGLAGILRGILVRPAMTTWPSNLAYVTFFNSLHARKDALIDEKRRKLFLIVFSVIFVWQFFPEFIWPMLTSVAVLCLANGDGYGSITALNKLGSAYSGFGLLTFAFDWSVIGSFTPLYTPFWASANFYFGAMLTVWIIGPIMYFTNTWNAKSFPKITTSSLYTKDFQTFNPLSVFDPVTQQLNTTAFNEVAPIQVTPFFAVNYAMAFASLGAVIIHPILFYHKEIRAAFRRRSTEPEDIHVKLMSVYPEVPQWVYGALFIVMTGLSILVCQVYDTGLPWWGVLLAIAICMFMIIPIGIIQAVSNQQIGLNVITRLICGFILPGRPIANTIFEVYGYVSLIQALLLTSDLKLGHYMKIPPRHLFVCQITGTILGVITNYFVLVSIMQTKGPYIDGELTDPTGQWVGLDTRIVETASIVWGLIGPQRFFVGLYKTLFLGFVFGMTLPVIVFLLHKKFPKAGFNHVVIPLIAAGSGWVPQVPANFITMGFIAAFISQFYIRKYKPLMFERYNFVTGAALDAATSINVLFIYLVFGLTKTVFPAWWGNNRTTSERCGL